MERLQKAQYIALGASAFSVIGGLLGMCGLNFGFILMGIGFITGIVSYVFGGFGTAVRMAGVIAKWGWIIVPFPYDILTFFLSFIGSIFVFIYLPIIPVRKAYKESVYYED